MGGFQSPVTSGDTENQERRKSPPHLCIGSEAKKVQGFVETDGHCIPTAHEASLPLPHPMVPSTPAEGLARVRARPTVTSLCQPHRLHGRDGQGRARATLVPEE